MTINNENISSINLSKRVITTKELAIYLRLNEKTVLKMAQNGELPGFKVANQWRFFLESIDASLQEQIIQSSEFDLNELILSSDDIIPISRLIKPEMIFLNEKLNSKNSVLEFLSKKSFEKGFTPSYDKLLFELNAREDMLSTAVGNGIAIPHARHPDSSLFSFPHIILLVLSNPIDFKSKEFNGIDLIFMPCSSSIEVHLRLVANIAKLVRKKWILENFKNAKSINDIYSTLLAYERDALFMNQAG